MSKFALIEIDAVVGKQQFHKLEIDGVCPFDEFEKGLSKQYKSELIGIYQRMNAIANLKPLPYDKFHFYDDGENGVREFEFKSKHLRVYGITQKNGKIIIMGGTKAKQKEEQSTFRKIKNEYLDSLTH